MMEKKRITENVPGNLKNGLWVAAHFSRARSRADCEYPLTGKEHKALCFGGAFFYIAYSPKPVVCGRMTRDDLKVVR